ncbi:ATP-binding protein [Fodinibius sp. AD559]|uniref:ATP-binding protein n=1 Tax=Fodinibius sp. AD559 TaxID=3424179 RepID=UPI004046B97C
MDMNIKTKLYAGLGFLALLVVLLWSSGLVFINMMADSSSAIIENNNRTLTYMQNIEQALVDYQLTTLQELNNQENREIEEHIDSLKNVVETNLKNQQENITEKGEAELTNHLEQKLMQFFENYGSSFLQSPLSMEQHSDLMSGYRDIQMIVAEISHKNLDAIRKKNEDAQHSAANIILYMTAIGVVSTLLALVLLIKYPSYIVNPIQELIARIKKISDQNYNQRLTFETGDEYEELAKAFNTMAKRLQEYESMNLAKLKNEKKRIEAIINQMSEAVIGLNRKMNILFVNAKAEELTGLNREQLVGKYAPGIASKNDLMRELLKDLMDDEDEQNDNEEQQLIKVLSGDRVIYYSRETQPVVMENEENANDDRKQIGTIITLKNVTHFQKINEAKTNFIAVVSHELKTPIASINMSLRLLEDERVGVLNEEQEDLINSIRNDTDRMKRTTSELLDLSKIETGNIQLNSQLVRPVNLLEYAYETMIMQANQNGIELKIEYEEGLPPVKADVQKSVWVLVNLISNAIRYSSSGKDIVLKAENRPRSIRFSVTDFGKGIPQEFQQKIFQKYVQINSDKDSGGSGLGLAIAKEFINAQGGAIDVESEPGEGSTFYFTLSKALNITEQ